MNILLATYSYYPYDWGGTEVYVKGLAQYLTGQGHSVMVIAGMPLKAFEEHPIFYNSDGIKAVRYRDDDIAVLGVVLKDESTEEIYSRYRAAWVQGWERIFEKMGIAQWDILHIHANTSLIGRALMEGVKIKSPGVKIFASYHLPFSCPKGTLLYANTHKACEKKPSPGTCAACMLATKLHWPLAITKSVAVAMPALQWKALPALWRTKYLLQQFFASLKHFDAGLDGWFVFSEQVQEVLQKMEVAPGKIKMLRHGIDPVFTGGGNRMADAQFFLYASRLHPVKGIYTLIQAWLQLPVQQGRQLWLCCTKENLVANIPSALKTIAGRSDVIFKNTQQQDGLALLMKQAHCVIIPSEWIEIGPLVFHEALAAGANIIASDIGGCRELATFYKNSAVQLFETGHATKLAGAIQNFIYQPQQGTPVLQEAHYRLLLDSIQQGSTHSNN